MYDRKSKYHDVSVVQQHLVRLENNVYFVCKSIDHPVSVADVTSGSFATLEMEGQVKYALHYGTEYLVQLLCTQHRLRPSERVIEQHLCDGGALCCLGVVVHFMRQDGQEERQTGNLQRRRFTAVKGLMGHEVSIRMEYQHITYCQQFMRKNIACSNKQYFKWTCSLVFMHVYHFNRPKCFYGFS